MGVRRAQHMADHHAGQSDVAHIVSFAPDQPRVLEARDALPDTEFTHSKFLWFCLRRPGLRGDDPTRGIAD